MKVSQQFTELTENGYNGQVSLRSLTKLLEFVLHMNNFTFNEVNYLQCGGTAMGTRLSPSYTNLFMDYIENKLLAGAPHKPIPIGSLMIFS